MTGANTQAISHVPLNHRDIYRAPENLHHQAINGAHLAHVAHDAAQAHAAHGLHLMELRMDTSNIPGMPSWVEEAHHHFDGVPGAGTSSHTETHSSHAGLMNLDNHVEYLQAAGKVNFQGKRGNHNTVSNLQGVKGSTINFGLMNLDNHVEYMQAAGTVNFQGAKGNKNTVGNLQGVKGSVINFGI